MVLSSRRLLSTFYCAFCRATGLEEDQSTGSQALANEAISHMHLHAINYPQVVNASGRAMAETGKLLSAKNGGSYRTLEEQLTTNTHTIGLLCAEVKEETSLLE